MSDRSEKAYKRKASTSSQLTANQERYGRNFTVGPADITPSLDLSRWTGSWAAGFSLGEGSVLLRNGTTVVDGGEGVHYSHLGQPGRPEINFRPYDFNTNRSGLRGPSLMGHPVSFSVVGPTAKSRVNDVQWEVVDNSASPGSGDTLTIYEHGALSVVTGVDTPPISTTLNGLFGRTNLSDFPGGLFLVVTQTGYEPDVVSSGNPGGLSDGGVWNPDTLSLLTPLNAGSKYEIFRVVDYNSPGGVLTLDSNKRLADYFTIGTPCLLRGIMLLEPAAAQMMALPGTGASRGSEQVFAFLPPTRSLNDDTQPPYDGGTSGDGTWLQGGLELYNPDTTAGTADEGYTRGALLPVPTPRYSGTTSDNPSADPALPVLRKGRVPTTAENTATAYDDAGNWRIVVEDSDADDLGRVICVRKVHKTTTSSPDEIVLNEIGGTSYPEDALLGFYEVVRVFTDSLDFYTLRRLADFDPQTGVIRHCTPDRIEIPVGTNKLELEFTVHDTIESLHTSPTHPHFAVSVCRLTHLIDPTRVGLGGLGSNGAGADAARHAAFSTVSGADPGSLADLGFGAVFYPAKLVGGVAVPDFELPIYPGSLTLDPSVSEMQTLEVDYDSGLAYLSHPPVSGSDVMPHGIISGSNNPRGQVVLFASFVVHSQESSQRGSGVWVRGGRPDSNVSAGPLCRKGAFPIYLSAVPNTGFNNQILLYAEPGEDIFPESGFGEIIEGADPNDPDLVPSTFLVSGRRVATVGYTSKGTWLDGGTERVALFGVYGGTVAADGPSYTSLFTGALSFVPRYDVVPPTNIDGVAGVAYSQDSNYGSALRSASLKIKDADVHLDAQGAVVTLPRLDDHEEIFSSALSNTVVEGGGYLSGGALGPTVIIRVNGGTCLKEGTLVRFEGGPLVVDDNTTSYVWVEGSRGGGFVKSGAAVPAGGILLHRITVASTVITDVVDLRNLHSNLDKRVEVTVGLPAILPLEGRTNQPHFFYLSDAVDYVTHVSVNGVPGASSGSTYKIRVISNTTITAPITVSLDGLIIEGTAGVNIDVTLASGEFAFDFNGTSGLQIRDLNFTLAKAGSGERYLFGGVGSDVVLENITFDGNDEGSFLSLGEDTTRVNVRNCRAFDLDHFGINTPDGLVSHVLVSDCSFTRSAAPDSAGDGVGIAYGGLIANASTYLNVQRTELVDWTRGALVDVAYNTYWENVRIYNCAEDGMTFDVPFLVASSAVLHVLNGVVVDTANTSATGFYGLYFNAPNIHVSNCSVVSTNTTLGMADVYFASSATSGVLENSICSGVRVLSDGCRILNNQVAFSIQYQGEDHLIKGNYLDTGDIESTGTADRTIIDTNNVGGGTSTKFGIILGIQAAIVSNNIVRNGNIEANAAKAVVTGNRVYFGTQGGNIDAAGDGAVVTGNILDADLSIGNNATVQGNNITGDIVTTTDAVKFIIMSNRTAEIRRSDSGANPDPTAIVLGNIVTGGNIFNVGVAGTTVDNNTN